MKILAITSAMLLASQFMCQAYAMELCEPQDYYNLANATKCSIQYNKAGSKSDPKDAMFEIMKNYPFEQKDAFAKLLQRKLSLVDNYKTQRQSKKHTEKVMAALSVLTRTKQVLSAQLKMVNSANKDNWVSVRDQARKALEESARSLRAIE